MSIVQTKKLFFTPKAWVQMWRLTEACPIEISALGLLLPGRDDVVQEFYVPKQKCSPVYTEMLDNELSVMQMELSAMGVDTSRLRVFFHSHVNMAASPSGTDESTIDRLANGAFLWSIITNKTGAAAALTGKDPGSNLYLRLDTYDPTNHTSATSVYRNTITNCAYSVLYQGTVTNKWIEESLAKVTTITQVTTATTPAAQQQNNWQTWVKGKTTTYPIRSHAASTAFDYDDEPPVWFNAKFGSDKPEAQMNWREKQQQLAVTPPAPKKEEKEVVVTDTNNVQRDDNLGYWERKWLLS